jgi:drug/metabolite transporter (DMT)-like permease
MALSGQARGILLGAGGAALISFDGLLIRLQALSPAGVTFWRGLLTGVAFAVMGVIARRGSSNPEGWRSGWLSLTVFTVLMVLGTVSWVFSLTHTSVAHTLVIVSSSPIATGILGFFLLRERLPVRTWVAGLAALVAVVVVVSDSLGRGDLQGDLWALLNTGILALMLIALRRYQKVNRLLALCLSGFLVAALVAPWGAQIADSKSMAAAALDGLLIVPGGLLMITLAPKYLPAAEVALVLLLETILAPLWVLLAVGEALTVQVLLSGAIILGAITVHSWMDLKHQRFEAAEPGKT